MKDIENFTEAGGVFSTPGDPEGKYFLLKLNSKDIIHAEASRWAANAYAKCPGVKKKLYEELRRTIDALYAEEKLKQEQILKKGYQRTAAELIAIDGEFRDWLSWDANCMQLALTTTKRYLIIFVTEDYHEVSCNDVDTLEEVIEILKNDDDDDSGWKAKNLYDLRDRKRIEFEVAVKKTVNFKKKQRSLLLTDC